MSQLKLSELAHAEPHDKLNRFNKEELRDGFFDPIYTKHTNIGDSTSPITTTSKPTESSKVRLPIPTTQCIKTVLSNYLKHWRIITKFTLAYLISMVLCLTSKPGSWFGTHRVWLPISVLINHPVHSFGTQLEMTLQSIIGIAIGLGWSSLALYISTATQPTRNHQGGILAGSLFLGLFFMGWFRAYYNRVYYMMLSSGLALIFMSANLKLDTAEVHWKYAWDFGIPYLFGLLVSLFVTVVYFPFQGREKITNSILEATASIRRLLDALPTVDKTTDVETVSKLQKEMINSVLTLAEDFREILSGAKFSLYNDEDLKHIRNHLNLMASPLRVLPTPVNIYFNKERGLNESNICSPNTGLSDSASTPVSSGVMTALPKAHLPHSLKSHHHNGIDTEMIYMSVMNNAFHTPLFKLTSQMVTILTQIETTIQTVSRMPSSSHSASKVSKEQLIANLTESRQLLKKRVVDMDVAYRKFTKTDYFCRDLLNEEAVINIFLTLRYTRQSAVKLVAFTDTVITASQRVTRWKFFLPHYPFRRALRRLPEQCLRDQGANSVFKYFEAKLDVDDAFERIYNLNTSRYKEMSKEHHHEHENSKIVRAIDHHDFNFHSTKNPLRFKLWELLRALNDSETKYAFKVSFVVLFLSLPAWLKESWNWYWTYNCYWCPILVYYFLSPRNAGNWTNLLTRTICWVIGCFWGWAANASRHYQHRVVIGVFAGLICMLFSYGFLVLSHPRSSFIGILGFTVVSMTVVVNAESNGTDVWKHSWIVSLAILVSIFTSFLTNRIIWPFIAKTELYKACSSLLQHIGQSYQSVSERYLYRDENDDPTYLTLELASIREVRMSQSVMAVRLLIEKACTEHHLTRPFKPDLFNRLLESCDTMLEKIIEARMSGVYFKVWEQDGDVKTTRTLLSYRRDSVATVIFLLYTLSNAFKTHAQLPRYLPSAIDIRKRMYDIIAQLEVQREAQADPIMDGLTARLTSLSSNQSGNHEKEKSYEKSHWTEVHGMAFARAFTAITEELENLVRLSKEILGEEGLFDT
ncbi:Protein BRE4 [Cyberlindnera fabianii]|uniref:Protein BRE4 n=1 Tax=Cyberlindnera fabianii TaxID=36022 RepID=A0A1V2L7V0_CYBFA|nr:Protein BRE4 [Cyberlindnera fabianii]